MQTVTKLSQTTRNWRKIMTDVKLISLSIYLIFLVTLSQQEISCTFWTIETNLKKFNISVTYFDIFRFSYKCPELSCSFLSSFCALLLLLLKVFGLTTRFMSLFYSAFLTRKTNSSSRDSLVSCKSVHLLLTPLISSRTVCLSLLLFFIGFSTAGIYRSKLTMEALKKGVKYIQSY